MYNTDSTLFNADLPFTHSFFIILFSFHFSFVILISIVSFSLQFHLFCNTLSLTCVVVWPILLYCKALFDVFIHLLLIRAVSTDWSETLDGAYVWPSSKWTSPSTVDYISSKMDLTIKSWLLCVNCLCLVDVFLVAVIRQFEMGNTVLKLHIG